MGTRTLGESGTLSFRRAMASLEAARIRPDVRLEEGPAPTRIAPHAMSMTAEVLRSPADEDALAHGRFVLLHDPACPEPWEGSWRIVTFAKAQLETELAADPVLGSVGWSWLMDALADRGLAHRAEAGTVTRVVSERFGSMADEAPTVDMEIRASWSPPDENVGEHLSAWVDLLCTIAGLPPLPDGVVPLPGQRR